MLGSPIFGNPQVALQSAAPTHLHTRSLACGTMPMKQPARVYSLTFLRTAAIVSTLVGFSNVDLVALAHRCLRSPTNTISSQFAAAMMRSSNDLCHHNVLFLLCLL